MLNLKNTLDGYLKNVEVIGNTIQDTNNLANIRSVGDKVEGQELYKIELACYGDNILRPDFEVGLWNVSNGTAQADSTAIRTKGFLRIRNQAHLVKRFDGKLGCQVILFDENFKYLGQQSYAGGNYVRYDNILPNAKYMKINFLNTTDLNLKCVLFDRVPSNINGVEFVEFQESELEILSPVQLQKVGNVADRIIYKDGVWGVEKWIGVYNFEGISGFGVRNTGDNISTIEFTMPIAVREGGDTLCICSSILGNTYNTIYNNTNIEGVGVKRYNTTNYCRFNILNNRLSSFDKVGFDKFINENNTKLYCVLDKATFIPLPHDQQVKLRTFAGQTNIAFLTEIPGQIKAQVPKSLGATVNTHTEQIADLHNSLERVKKLEETTVSTVETESNFTTVNETSNGYFEDVKLEGKTLVNHIDFNTKFINIGFSHTNNVVTLTSNDTWGSVRLPIPSSLKPNTKYTVVLNILENSDSSNRVYYSDCSADASPYKSKSYLATPEGLVTGLFATVLETVDDFTGKNIGVRLSNYNCSAKFTFMLLEGDHTNNPPSYFEGLMSVGQDVEEVSVESRNSDETQSNKKPLLYYNPTTETWEKPVLREWDTIEKHSDGKYYFHQRSEEVNYISGDESLLDCITDMNKTVKKISTEKIYECTNIDLMTYSGETNYIINSGAISPKSLLKVHNNISNVVKILQEKVSLLENTFIAGLKSVLSGDMYSLATILYPEDFEQNDNIEQDIMVIPE